MTGPGEGDDGFVAQCDLCGKEFIYIGMETVIEKDNKYYRACCEDCIEKYEKK